MIYSKRNLAIKDRLINSKSTKNSLLLKHYACLLKMFVFLR